MQYKWKNNLKYGANVWWGRDANLLLTFQFFIMKTTCKVMYPNRLQAVFAHSICSKMCQQNEFFGKHQHLKLMLYISCIHMEWFNYYENPSHVCILFSLLIFKRFFGYNCLVNKWKDNVTFQSNQSQNKNTSSVNKLNA